MILINALIFTLLFQNNLENETITLLEQMGIILPPIYSEIILNTSQKQNYISNTDENTITRTNSTDSMKTIDLESNNEQLSNSEQDLENYINDNFIILDNESDLKS